MSKQTRGVDGPGVSAHTGRRKKRFLAASEKYEILQLVR